MFDITSSLVCGEKWKKLVCWRRWRWWWWRWWSFLFCRVLVFIYIWVSACILHSTRYFCSHTTSHQNENLRDDLSSLLDRCAALFHFIPWVNLVWLSLLDLDCSCVPSCVHVCFFLCGVDYREIKRFFCF